MKRNTGEHAESCLTVRRVLQGYLDGEVDAHRATGITAHLEVCSRCRVERELLDGVRAALRAQRARIDPATRQRLTALLDTLTGPGQ